MKKLLILSTLFVFLGTSSFAGTNKHKKHHKHHKQMKHKANDKKMKVKEKND